MSEKTIPFVVNDRRKFTSEGEVREGVDLTPAPNAPEPLAAETASDDAAPGNHDNLVEMPVPQVDPIAEHETTSPEAASSPADEETFPPAPTPDQMEQSKRAFDATADRLETAIRAANPGADHPPALTFESLVQSVYMQAVMQLGGGGASAGEQPQIDLMGAKQSIDMLGILFEKTAGQLTTTEDLLLQSALFELRLAFLEMTQALARSAQQQQQKGPLGTPGTGGGLAGGPGGRPGPSIVR